MNDAKATHYSHVIRIDDLTARRDTAFALVPDADARTAVAATVDALKIGKLRFAGQLRPVGRRDWRLEADLGATVTQSCVITLTPVTTRIDLQIQRQFIAGLEPDEAAEAEMPEDETVEPLTPEIDLGMLMTEALALALPLYPRAPDAELGEAIFSPEGTAPLTDEEMRPFAGLAELKKKLDK